MSRLPTPGGDSGNWGDILNDFLGQAHNTDGTIKTGAVSKSDVGLGNVTNTADADKPVSTAQATALAGKADLTSGKVPDGQLPTRLSDASLGAAYLPLAPPSYAGARTRPYDQQRNIYRATPAEHRKIRASLGHALANSALVPIMFIGDSITAGYKSVPGISDPVTVTRNLFKAAGWPVTGGWVFPANGATSSVDSRWTFPSGTWGGANTTTNGYRFTSTTNATALFTSDLPGTIAEFTVFCTSNAPIAYSIDGGSETLYTATPGSVNKVQTTGLANTTHTIQIRRNGSSTVWIGPARVRTATGLSISNAGVYGSFASDWLPASGGSVYYNCYNLAMGLETPKLVFVGLGANEAFTTATVATMTTSLTTVVQSAQAVAPVVIKVHSPIADSVVVSPGTVWTDWVKGMYDAADNSGAILIDHTDAMGSNTETLANGLQYDQYHPYPPGYAAIARRDYQALLAI